MSDYRVYVCHNRDCKERGAARIWSTFQREVTLRGLDESVELIVAGCQGRCAWGPNVTVHPGATKYCHLDPAGAAQIVEQHLVGKMVVEAYRYEEEV